MENIYTTIKLDNQFINYIDISGKPLTQIDKLSKINIFVGENNSGKSRFTRLISQIKNYEYKTKSTDLNSFNNNLDNLQATFQRIQQRYPGIISFVNANGRSFNLKQIINDILARKSDCLIDGFKEKIKLNDLINLLSDLKNSPFRVDSYNSSIGYGNDIMFSNEIQKIFNNEIYKRIEFLEKFSINQPKQKKVYIPILRNLNNLNNPNLYKDRVIKTYKFDAKHKVEIFTGLTLYDDVRNLLLGSQDERKRIREFELYLSKNFFSSSEVSLVPKVGDDSLNVKIGNQEQPIYHLGDGIQSIIMLTFPAFVYTNSLFFIEEPELCLHPGMQRKLLSAFLQRSDNQYFITTHSNHFLDLTLDYDNISIYTFKTDKIDYDKKKVEQVLAGDEKILHLLGVNNSSVFLSNSTIWVEGVTDRLYIRKFLELYQGHNKLNPINEDIDYSFIEYGGNNITHWSFLDKNNNSINVERLCGKLILVTDDDGDKKKIERKKELKKNLGNRYIKLDCKEIENILSLNTIERVLRIYENNSSYVMPKFKVTHPHKNYGIGKFIEEKMFNKGNPMRRKHYKTKSGSINDKVTFCERVIENLTYEEMSIMARNLAKKLYDFVSAMKK